MKIPTRKEAETLLNEVAKRNPGPWTSHSAYVAKAAEIIAAHHPRLNPEVAYILGYLHDLGRSEGVTHMRHIIDGYRLLHDRGFDDAARACMTHSFPLQDVNAVFGKWDCTPQEFEFAKTYLSETEYNDYDRLIQLCDALALPSGFCLIEKRLVDVALRYGPNGYTVPKWTAVLNLLKRFEDLIGRSIYSILPGVVENTFGFNPSSASESA